MRAAVIGVFKRCAPAVKALDFRYSPGACPDSKRAQKDPSIFCGNRDAQITADIPLTT